MLGKWGILCQTNYSQGQLLASDVFEVAKWLCFFIGQSHPSPQYSWRVPRLTQPMQQSLVFIHVKHLVTHKWQLIAIFPVGSPSKESACSAGDVKSREFDPWVRKMPWRRKWQPAPARLPEKAHGQSGGLPCTGPRSWTRLSNSAAESKEQFCHWFRNETTWAYESRGRNRRLGVNAECLPHSGRISPCWLLQTLW